MYHAVEHLMLAYNELALACSNDERLVNEYFDLTPFQQAMWQAFAPFWHAIARADVFRTKDGLRICEINSDTPSGQAEAVLLNEICALPSWENPNQHFEQQVCSLVQTMTSALTGRNVQTIGIVYPTEFTEDLSMIALYQTWFARRGYQTVLGSPYNLDRQRDGRLTLFGVPCDAVMRHYKTDWWGEREGAWDDDDPIADQEPLHEPLKHLLGAALDGQVAVINPMGAVLTQNKRAMAALWGSMDLWSDTARKAIEAYLPFTAPLEAVRDTIRLEKDDWVLKSDYGCEGDQVIIGRACDQQLWEASLLHAMPRKWIAQRCFSALQAADGSHANYGVYVLGGRPSGFFTRRESPVTDMHALATATFVTDERHS